MRKRTLGKIYDAHRGYKPEVFEFMEEGDEDYTPSVIEWVKSYAEQDVYKNRYDNKPFPKETFFPWPSGLSVKEKLASEIAEFNRSVSDSRKPSRLRRNRVWDAKKPSAKEVRGQ